MYCVCFVECVVFLCCVFAGCIVFTICWKQFICVVLCLSSVCSVWLYAVFAFFALIALSCVESVVLYSVCSLVCVASCFPGCVGVYCVCVFYCVV